MLCCVEFLFTFVLLLCIACKVCGYITFIYADGTEEPLLNYVCVVLVSLWGFYSMSSVSIGPIWFLYLNLLYIMLTE